MVTTNYRNYNACRHVATHMQYDGIGGRIYMYTKLPGDWHGMKIIDNIRVLLTSICHNGIVHVLDD